MNQQIKDILKKHIDCVMITYPAIEIRLDEAIIEICELQKQSSASEIKDLDYESWMRIMNSQNIAE